MPKVLFLAKKTEETGRLVEALRVYDLYCTVASDASAAGEMLARVRPDLMLLEVDSGSELRTAASRLQQESKLPTIALARLETLAGLNGQLDTDDFVKAPADAQELAVRARRLLRKTTGDAAETIRGEQFVIDTSRCEVTVAGRPIALTFKEYELLKFLALNPGRVFTRQVLLDRVWGHDYFGGDRTVDVHVRRLRSKLEVAGLTFIETVRSIGYAFRQSTEQGAP